MNIAFRVDAFNEIGLGLMIRCYTLPKNRRFKNIILSFMCKVILRNYTSKLQMDGF